MFYRKYLGHEDVPGWVAWSAVFSVTICTLPRGANNLCFDPVGSAILNAARHYDRLEKWDVRLLLLMPDHLHLIVAPCLGYSLSPLSPGEMVDARLGHEWRLRYVVGVVGAFVIIIGRSDQGRREIRQRPDRHPGGVSRSPTPL